MIPFGRVAKNWVCADVNQSPIRRHHKAQLAWQAFWFDVNWALQKKAASRFPLLVDPVFIIGLWRSGTTYLHDLLSQHPAFYTPETWQCMAASTFALMGLPGRSKSLKRPMDHHVVETQSPQEDEFALMALGIPSAYLGFFRPDRLADLEFVLEPKYWLRQHDEEWYAEWLRFLEMLPNRNHKRLLLKSPNHTFRIPSLARLFPCAKWIYLYRETEGCLRSNRKMWGMMFEKYSVTSTRLDLLDGFLGSACDGVTICLDWANEHLPATSLIGIKLEDLSRNPLAAVTRILRFLAVGSHEGYLKGIAFNNGEMPVGSVTNSQSMPLPLKLSVAGRMLTEKHQKLFG